MGVHLFWDSRVPVGLSRPVSEELSAVLEMPVSRIDNEIFPLEGFDPLRNQYDAVKVLQKLDMFRRRTPQLFKPADMDMAYYNKFNHIYEKILLVTPGDLYEPLADFVFGLAYPKLGVGIVSPVRLRNEFYGKYEDDSALIDRIVKESAHEIGHLFGLGHCDNPGCIMYCPRNLDELDRKRKYFCGKCRVQLTGDKSEDELFS
ncbi:MAG TPA: archaemetzincin family Zn-dependent metalloprotease [Methanocorpusculum sp.]|nr:archaemetzincin family Zn-dependent metalloprotease [Methanocorpusculum sp.]